MLEQFGAIILSKVTFSLDAVTSGQTSLENKFVSEFGSLNMSLDTLNNKLTTLEAETDRRFSEINAKFAARCTAMEADNQNKFDDLVARVEAAPAASAHAPPGRCRPPRVRQA